MENVLHSGMCGHVIRTVGSAVRRCRMSWVHGIMRKSVSSGVWLGLIGFRISPKRGSAMFRFLAGLERFRLVIRSFAIVNRLPIERVCS